MRTVSPAMTRPVTVAGTGSVFVSGSGSLHRDRDLRRRELAFRLDAILGLVFAGALRREVAQPIVGGEEQAVVGLLDELGRERDRQASGCSSFASTGMSIDVPDARRDHVGRRDGRLGDCGHRDLDERHLAFGLGEAVADAVAERRRPGGERSRERDPQKPVLDDLDPDALALEVGVDAR